MGARIVQLGAGNVGRELIKIGNQKLKFISVSDISGTISDENCLSENQLDEIIKMHEENKKIREMKGSKSNEIIKELINGRCILVDVTASDDTTDLLLKAKENSCFVVLANKKPLCKDYKIYKKLADGGTYYEATVGAGLPIIKTIKYLLDTGDKINEISGCFSGTLGFICTEIEKGTLFSEAVKKAKEAGYTEPDPRDDLNGMDVARKALILAREIGFEIELKDVAVEPMLGNNPRDLLKLNVEEFMREISSLDEYYKEKVENARKRGAVLRYVAEVKDGKYSASLNEVSADSQIGSLRGTDNIVIIKSGYYPNSMVIRGAGAGSVVTAGAVWGDINEIIKCEAK